MGYRRRARGRRWRTSVERSEREGGEAIRLGLFPPVEVWRAFGDVGRGAFGEVSDRLVSMSLSLSVSVSMALLVDIGGALMC